MHSRTASITNPLQFGRRRRLQAAAVAADRVSRFGDDLRLFATTFAAGFVFVSLYLL